MAMDMRGPAHEDLKRWESLTPSVISRGGLARLKSSDEGATESYYDPVNAADDPVSPAVSPSTSPPYDGKGGRETARRWRRS